MKFLKLNAICISLCEKNEVITQGQFFIYPSKIFGPVCSLEHVNPNLKTSTISWPIKQRFLDVMIHRTIIITKERLLEIMYHNH